MTTLDSLLVKIDASTELLRRELAKGGASVDSFARNTDKRLGGIGATFNKVTTALRGTLAAFGVGFGATAVTAFTRSAIQAADAIGETSKAAGFGAERFQRLSFVFRQNGVSASEFEGAMRTLNTRFGQFLTTGAGPAAKAIEQLGIKQRVASGEIRTSEQLFDAITDALGGVGNSAERAALASAFFGREAGAKLADTLGRGTRAIDEAAQAATGIVTDETVRKASALSDAWERFNTNLLKTAAIQATFDLGELFGVDEVIKDLDSLESQIARLEHQSKMAAVNERAGLGVVRSSASLDSEIAKLKEYQRLINTPFITTSNAVQPQNDRLQEVSTSYGRLPSGMRQFDFVGARRTIEQSALQEIQVRINKMPDDLKKLSPEFNKFVESLSRGNDELEKMREKQQQLLNAIGHSLQSTLADAFLGIETDFKGLLKRMAAEFLSSQLVSSMMSFFGGSSGGGGFGGFFAGLFGGKRADGGPVQAGKGYLVNDGKPELFWPGMSGAMVPVAATGGGGVQITLYQSNTFTGGDSREQAAALAANNARLRQEIKAEIQDLQRRGRF